MKTVSCPRCQHVNHRVRRPSSRYGVALVATALLFVGMVLASSLIGPFIMFAVPVMAVVGFAFGPLHALLTDPPTCAKCGRTLAAAPTAAELARRRAAVARPVAAPVARAA
jgi:hypothetical protein